MSHWVSLEYKKRRKSFSGFRRQEISGDSLKGITLRRHFV